MAREYMITTTMAGTDLQVTGDEVVEQHFTLQAASDEGQLREAEGIINEHFYGLDPFPGFDWQPMGTGGWRTTDHDLRPR